MASVIYYKFQSEKNFKQIKFDAVSLSAFDVKKEIVLQDKLAKGAENFDLKLFNAQTNEEYRDDFDMIPRNTSVKVSRVAGNTVKNASRYLAGVSFTRRGVHAAGDDVLGNFGAASKGAFSLKSANFGPSVVAGNQGNSVPNGEAIIAGETEQDKINAVYAQTEELFKAQSESIAASQQKKGLVYNNMNRRLVNTNGGTTVSNTSNNNLNNINTTTNNSTNSSSAADPNATNAWTSAKEPVVKGPVPPANYVCDRCGIPGHFKQNCPTWGNPAFDSNRFKKISGIPRSFLKTVKSANELQASTEEPFDPAQLLHSSGHVGGSVMVTSTGEFVVATINDDVFKKHVQQMQGSVAVGSIEQIYDMIKEMEESGQVEKGKFMPPNLLCKICSGLLKDAVYLDCCKTPFCDSCIRQNLISQAQLNKIICPSCKKNTNLDHIIIDKPRRALTEQTLKLAVESYKKIRQKASEAASTQQKKVGVVQLKDDGVDLLMKKYINNPNFEIPENFRKIDVIDTSELRTRTKSKWFYEYHDLSSVKRPEIDKKLTSLSSNVIDCSNSLSRSNKRSVSDANLSDKRGRYDRDDRYSSRDVSYRDKDRYDRRSPSPYRRRDDRSRDDIRERSPRRYRSPSPRRRRDRSPRRRSSRDRSLTPRRRRSSRDRSRDRRSPNPIRRRSSRDTSSRRNRSKSPRRENEETRSKSSKNSYNKSSTTSRTSSPSRREFKKTSSPISREDRYKRTREGRDRSPPRPSFSPPRDKRRERSPGRRYADRHY